MLARDQSYAIQRPVPANHVATASPRCLLAEQGCTVKQAYTAASPHSCVRFPRQLASPRAGRGSACFSWFQSLRPISRRYPSYLVPVYTELAPGANQRVRCDVQHTEPQEQVGGQSLLWWCPVNLQLWWILSQERYPGGRPAGRHPRC